MKSYARINRFTHPKLAATLVAVLVLATSATVIVACSDLVGPDKPAGVAEAPPAPPPPPAAMPDGEVFVIVDEMPEIVGGLAALQQNLRYPALAKMAGVEGRVIVQFVVDEQGDVVDPVVVRGVGSGLDEAAIAAVRETKFKPGRQAGEPVKVKLSIPITFKLPESASDAQTNSISDLSSPTFDARTMRLALRRMASKMRSIQNE